MNPVSFVVLLGIVIINQIIYLHHMCMFVLHFALAANHLDMETMDALIYGLNEFKGGVILVSHDEYVISTVCDRIWVVGDHKVREFDGDFGDYRKLMVKALKL